MEAAAPPPPPAPRLIDSSIGGSPIDSPIDSPVDSPSRSLAKEHSYSKLLSLRQLSADHHAPSQAAANRALPELPSSLDFYRRFVSKSRPGKFKLPRELQEALGPLSSLESLQELLGDRPIKVNVTPEHGLGDALFPKPGRANDDRANDDPAELLFVEPQEQEMTFKEFAEHLRPGGTGPERVYYLSSQNDNLHGDLSALLDVVPRTLPFAQEAFGAGPPEAVNLWVGDGRAVTTMHRDPFENVYLVLEGTKTFVLVPPYMGGALYQGFYRRARWRLDGGEDRIEEDEDRTRSVRWVGVDVEEDRGKEEYPLLDAVEPITIDVHAGEMLYLPSMWFHKVKSSGVSISVNFWFDMAFDTPNYVLSEWANAVFDE
ncbi:hypothetical protein TeGR_g12787 [Tetraparma gracilis]|uniref:JmjC domain-containing protein n=1 Tax=Tetraparma gracilis TaxID=2962635 RepID=A0ABQ6NDY5_9STRA|nr:hypothetical protein TeGR_g12787 [Tetraparma gracilis]